MLAHKGCVREARDVFAQVRGGEGRGGGGEGRRGEGRGGEERGGEGREDWAVKKLCFTLGLIPSYTSPLLLQRSEKGKKIGLRGDCATSSPSFAVAKVCTWW